MNNNIFVFIGAFFALGVIKSSDCECFLKKYRNGNGNRFKEYLIKENFNLITAMKQGDQESINKFKKDATKSINYFNKDVVGRGREGEIFDKNKKKLFNKIHDIPHSPSCFRRDAFSPLNIYEFKKNAEEKIYSFMGKSAQKTSEEIIVKNKNYCFDRTKQLPSAFFIKFGEKGVKDLRSLAQGVTNLIFQKKN